MQSMPPTGIRVMPGSGFSQQRPCTTTPAAGLLAGALQHGVTWRSCRNLGLPFKPIVG
jgi:hypothetical protein